MECQWCGDSPCFGYGVDQMEAFVGPDMDLSVTRAASVVLHCERYDCLCGVSFRVSEVLACSEQDGCLRLSFGVLVIG